MTKKRSEEPNIEDVKTEDWTFLSRHSSSRNMKLI